MMLTEKQIDFICDDLIHPFHFLWFAIGAEYGVSASQDDPSSFVSRRKDFLDLLRRLLQEDKLRLAKDGVFLTGSVDEQAAKFEASFPTSDADVDLGGAGTWFFTDECPAGAVWVTRGSAGEEVLEWT
ncbi:DUF596 domain-containing protein [Ralstonia solanacearum]|uniref:DUF596 domain-containing protein n=1 Tax=Ralstonia solanacearum TaxID=305 RepID=A0AAE3NIK3_RALSL|nr:DUF596 domain-containing protein [Ralstonia solanacearum]MDB0524422.1 DUF596 domain-containing protein [Ralstonia solanacearum]